MKATLLHFQDGKASTALLATAFFLLVGVFKDPVEGLNMFATKRTPPELQPSQFRYIMNQLSTLLGFDIICLAKVFQNCSDLLLPIAKML